MQLVTGLAPEVKFIAERIGDVKHSENDPTLLRQVFTEVEPVDFDHALSQTNNWLMQEARNLKT